MLYKIRNQEVNISTSHKLIPPDKDLKKYEHKLLPDPTM